MPGQTPIFGFPFPCPGENITGSEFMFLANAIDSKLTEVNADMAFALNRPNLDLLAAVDQVIAPGALTALTSPTSTFVVSTAGVWIIWMGGTATASPATITFARMEVRQNGVARYAFGTDSEANNYVPTRPVCAMVCAAGDVISGAFQYTGTGTITLRVTLSAKLFCRIA